ncbi:uncharacterized protein TNCV_3006801 [Trichonephila clavipes]|nr:uncharacterized protein TNCV_3006801 [Trichonephila clavipes]
MYVSQPKSACDKNEIPDNLMDSVNLSHFHINQPLHPHNIAILCTLFPGGIEKLVLEQLGYKNVSSWEKVNKRVPDPWYNVRWEVPIHVTGWKFLNCLIPLHPRYEETEELYLNLYGNKKLHLQDQQCSFQWIRDEMYVLSRKQQNTTKEIKKVKKKCTMDQKVILKAKLNEMKAKNELIRKEKDILKEENDVLKTNEQDWKTKENELNSKLQGTSRENKVLKRVLQGKNGQYLFQSMALEQSSKKIISTSFSSLSTFSFTRKFFRLNKLGGIQK